jgi:hypothetical protein
LEEEKMILIIGKYLAGKASIEEVKLVDTWFDSFETRPSLFNFLSPSQVEELSSNMYMKISESLNLNTTNKMDCNE